MIVLQRLLIRCNVYQSVQKVYSQVNIKYISTRITRYTCTCGPLKINLLPNTCLKFTNKYSSYKKVNSRTDVLHGRQGIPNEYSLIYKAPLRNSLTLLYPIALISTLAVSAYLLSNNIVIDESVYSTDAGPLALIQDYNEVLYFIAAQIVIGSSVVLFILKYPFKVFRHNSSKKYIAIIHSAIPFKTKQIHFTSATRSSLVFNIWSNIIYKLGTTKVFLFEDNFRRPVDLENMISKTDK